MSRTGEEMDAEDIEAAITSAAYEAGRNDENISLEVDGVALIDAYVLRSVVASMVQSAKDVCMYCDGCAPQWARVATGPNEAGNYTHGSRSNAAKRVLCRASAIHSRLERLRGQIA